MRDLEQRLAFSASLLGIPEDGQVICDRLLNSDFIDLYYAKQANRRARRNEQT